MDALPLVLLGIRTALKEDASSTTAEMVYGTTLRLPGEFFSSSPTPSLTDPSDYVSQLKAHMQRIRPPLPRPTNNNSQVSNTLSTATHVFVRHDAVKRPLQPPYDGPFEVVKRTDKHFTLNINGHHDTVSVDRLKAAHIDVDTHPPPPTPQTTTVSNAPDRVTRSGRRVHFPDYLSHSCPETLGGK